MTKERKVQASSMIRTSGTFKQPSQEHQPTFRKPARTGGGAQTSRVPVECKEGKRKKQSEPAQEQKKEEEDAANLIKEAAADFKEVIQSTRLVPSMLYRPPSMLIYPLYIILWVACAQAGSRQT
jgi:hypothetical protein